MKDLYYTPLKESITLGFECEIRFRIDMGILARLQKVKILFEDEWNPIAVGNIVNKDEYGFDLNLWLSKPTDHANVIWHLSMGMIRVPVLSKENILSLGWTEDIKSDYCVFYKKSDYTLMKFNKTDIIIISQAEKSGDRTLFNGECLCINQLRIIEKLVL